MNNQHEIAIDPYLLCLPNPCKSADELERFILGLLAWSECLDRPNVRVLVADVCSNGLAQDQQYPVPQHLPRLMHQYHIDFADPPTVSRLVLSVLERTPSLEDVCGISCVVFDDAGFSATPDFFLNRLGAATRAGFCESLVILAVRHQFHPSLRNRVTIASALDEGEDEAASEIEIHSKVDEVEWHATVAPPDLAMPVNVTDTIDVFGSHEDFLRGVGAVELWGNAESEEGARDAIDQTIHELIAAGAAAQEDVQAYGFGNRFLESVQQWDFAAREDYARILIESCARIVIDQPKNEVRPFRVDKKRTSRQRERDDGALAFRTHLTKKGPGFRLMLWRTTGNVIEFSNVGPKHEELIL